MYRWKIHICYSILSYRDHSGGCSRAPAGFLKIFIIV